MRDQLSAVDAAIREQLAGRDEIARLPVLLDRLLHHAIVVRIEGASYRLRRHADLLPDSSGTRPTQQPDPAPRRRGRPPKPRLPELTAKT